MLRPRILPVFLPLAACGNKCVYCDQNIISGVGETKDIVATAKAQIKKWTDLIKKWDEVAFYGGNFGAIDKNIRRELYALAHNTGISNIRYSTRPDTITSELIAEIKDEKINFIELGIQSLNDKTLELNLRPYSGKQALYAIEKVSSITSCGVQIMTGMYGQTGLSCLEDGKVLSRMPIKAARIYPTAVLKGTKLSKLFKTDEYKPLTFAETIVIASGVYIYFTSEAIPVIRVGLHLDGSVGKGIEGGIIHTALGDIVKTFVASLYASLGLKIGFAGYRGFVRKNFTDFFEISQTDFVSVCRRIKEVYLEDNRGYITGPAANIAGKLESASHNG